MAQQILDLYEAKQTELGVDKISFAAGQAAQTPYSVDDNKNIDEQVVTAEKFGVGRGGPLNNVLYSSTVTR
jgi:hypothetical protein